MLSTFRDASLPLLPVVLIAALLLATEAGRIVARRGRREDKDAGGLATGMLEIYALLIAFTYSLSLARYDARRTQVLEEANAIGTTANYALMLPPAHRIEIERLLRDYDVVRTRLDAPHDEAAFATDNAASNAVLAKLWAQATTLTAENPQSLPTYRFVAALNEQTNIAEARVTTLRNHVPAVVLLALAGIAMVSLGFAGTGSGARRLQPLRRPDDNRGDDRLAYRPDDRPRSTRSGLDRDIQAAARRCPEGDTGIVNQMQSS